MLAFAHTGSVAEPADAPPETSPTDLEGRLDRWVEHGLVSAEQASAIAAWEAGHPAIQQQRGGTVLAETVGYLGAVLTVVAGGLVLEEFWERITSWGRLLLVGLLTAAVFAAGWVLRNRAEAAVQRLVGVLWFASSVGIGVLAGLAANDAAVSEEGSALAVMGAVAVVSAGLYLLRRSTLQLVALSLGLAGTAVAGVLLPRADPDPLFVGLLLWALGVAWLLLAAGGWLEPRRTAQVLGLLGLGVGCQVGAFGAHAGTAIVLGLLTAAVLLWRSAVTGDTVVLSFAAAGVFVFVPQAVFEFFSDTIGAPLALLATGLLLVAAAVGLLLLRREIGDEPATEEPA